MHSPLSIQSPYPTALLDLDVMIREIQRNQLDLDVKDPQTEVQKGSRSCSLLEKLCKVHNRRY